MSSIKLLSVMKNYKKKCYNYIQKGGVLMDSIGSRIRNARKKAGLTQAQLSEQAFISESYMALIELNKRNPSTDVVTKIAEILSVSADHLLFGDIPKNELTLYTEWQKLMEGRSLEEISSAQKLVQTFFESIDNLNDNHNRH